MKTTLLSLITLACFIAPAALADKTLQTAASAVVEKRAAQSLVISITRKAGDEDSTFETTAVAVNGSGLLATSLSALERSNDLKSLMDFMMSDDEEDEDTGELTRVAWIRDDATEVEGELVLKDELLDLAIIRLEPGDGVIMPEAPPVAASAPALLENTLAIGRLAADFQRAPRVGLGHVSALVTSPRALYQISGDPSPGLPVYNLQGEWLGIAASIEGKTLVVPAAAILSRADSVADSEKP